MRQPYEQNFDQNFKPELTYEECLHIVKNLEAVRRAHLINSPIVDRAARFMQREKIYNLPALSHLIEDAATNSLKHSG